jgi:hypothetical protein
MTERNYLWAARISGEGKIDLGCVEIHRETAQRITLVKRDVVCGYKIQVCKNAEGVPELGGRTPTDAMQSLKRFLEGDLAGLAKKTQIAQTRLDIANRYIAEQEDK